MDRQLLQENLNRFFGGSGHSHPIYYYISYLFIQGLPWSLFLPFLFWDAFKQGFSRDDDHWFLQLWFLVMLVFFSLSAGKRPVYLLPLYPALSLLLAAWLYHHEKSMGIRLLLYRMVALVAGVTGLVLLSVTLGAMWNHNPGWFFAPIEALLKAKDRANLVVVENQLNSFGWLFTLVSLASSLLWISFAHGLWTSRLRSAAGRLVLIFILLAIVSQGIVVPVIAAAKSYRPFMMEVNRRVMPGEPLYLYGGWFYYDPVEFYRGALIETLDQSPQQLAKNIGAGNAYVIMARQTWVEILMHNPNLPPPILESTGTGPEGDAPLVLVQAGGW